MISVILNGKTDISDFIKAVNLSGDTSKFNRQLDVSIHATTDGRAPAFAFSEGDTLSFRYKNIAIFIGIIFRSDISSDGDLTLTAYDSNVYLSKSNANRTFTNRKASDIIRMIAKDFDIPLGDIADTGYVIPYLKFQNRTLYDIILTALTLTRKQTGKRFFISNKSGKLTLTAGVSSNPRYIFKDGENLISASYSRSIEDTKTQVVVIGGAKGKETVIVAKDEEKRKKYGVMQVIEELDEKATASQVKQRAATLLKEESVVSEQFSVEVVGVPAVDVGTPVYIVNAMTKTNGAYYVTSVNHSFSVGLHTMTLELTRTYELPDITIDSSVTTREEAKK